MGTTSYDGLILEHTKAAMKKIDYIRPYVVDGPVTMQIEHTSRSAPGIDAAMQSDSDRVDARTLLFHGKNLSDAWTQARR